MVEGLRCKWIGYKTIGADLKTNTPNFLFNARKLFIYTAQKNEE